MVMQDPANPGQFVRYAYNVFLDKCSQNATDVTAEYDYVLGRIHEDHPELKGLYEKADNAGKFD